MTATLRRLDLRRVTGDLKGRLPRPALDGEGPVAAVRDILAEVNQGGDAAVRALTERSTASSSTSSGCPRAAMDAALAAIPAPLRDALEAARAAIESFQRSTAAAGADLRAGRPHRGRPAADRSTGPVCTCPAAGPGTPRPC